MRFFGEDSWYRARKGTTVKGLDRTEADAGPSKSAVPQSKHSLFLFEDSWRRFRERERERKRERERERERERGREREWTYELVLSSNTSCGPS